MVNRGCAVLVAGGRGDVAGVCAAASLPPVLNPTRSLLPCIAAHAAKNAGVFVIKAAQGHVSGWW